MSRKHSLHFSIGLTFIHFIHQIDSIVIMPLSLKIIDSLKISAGKYGSIVTFYMIGAFISTIFGYYFISKINKRILFLLSNLIVSLLFLITTIFNNFTYFVLARFFIGLFVGISNILLFYYIRVYFKSVDKEKAISSLSYGYGLAIILGIPFIVYLSTLFTWKLSFFILFFASLVSSIFLHKFVPLDNIRLKNTSSYNYLKDFKSIYTLLIVFLSMITQAIFVPFLMLYFIKNLGGTELGVTMSLVMGGVFMLVFAKPTERLIIKYGTIKALQIISMLVIISIFPLIILPERFLLLSYGTITAFIVSSSSQVIALNSYIVSDNHNIQEKEKFISLSVAVQYLSLSFSAWIGSKIIFESIDFKLLNFNILVYISIICTCLTLVLLKFNHFK